MRTVVVATSSVARVAAGRGYGPAGRVVSGRGLGLLRSGLVADGGWRPALGGC